MYVQIHFSVVGALDAVHDHVDQHLLQPLGVALHHLWKPVGFVDFANTREKWVVLNLVVD
jgi:hypothetical protein